MLLRQARNFAGYEAQQRELMWKRILVTPASDLPAAVLQFNPSSDYLKRNKAQLAVMPKRLIKSPHCWLSASTSLRKSSPKTCDGMAPPLRMAS